jgi:hypothetical protein
MGIKMGFWDIFPIAMGRERTSRKKSAAAAAPRAAAEELDSVDSVDVQLVLRSGVQLLKARAGKVA